MPSLKLLTRAARRLQEAWPAKPAPMPGDAPVALERLGAQQQALERAAQRLKKARARGLSLAVPRLREGILRRVQAVQEAARLACECLEQPVPLAPTFPTL